jgi:hypothetical protein
MHVLVQAQFSKFCPIKGCSGCNTSYNVMPNHRQVSVSCIFYVGLHLVQYCEHVYSRDIEGLGLLVCIIWLYEYNRICITNSMELNTTQEIPSC